MPLKRRVGFGLLTLYGVGVMVGAGIYVLVGKVAGVAGPLTPLAFLAAGVAAGLSALSFAELSARIPESAGEAAYVEAAFRIRWLSLLVGLATASVGVISAAAILKGGVDYLSAFVPAPLWSMELAVGVLLGVIAAVGVVESLAFAAILTVIEVIGLAAVAAAGFQAEPVLPYAAMASFGDAPFASASVILAGAGLAFFAFIGFEDMVNLAEEVVDPVRTLPRAIFAAVLLTTLLYGLISVTALRAVEQDVLAASARPLALIFEKGGGAPEIIAAIAIFATLNGVLAQLVMAARVMFGLGRRTSAFAWAQTTSPRFGTPVRATAVATGAMLALAAVAPIETLAHWTTYVLLTVFIVVNGALILLKRRGPGPAGAPDIPIAFPIAGVLTSAILLAA